MLAKLNALLKNGVNPKWIVVLAWLVGVQKGIGQGAISLTNMVPDAWIPHIIAWNNGLAWLGVGLMGLLAALSSSETGPLIPNISIPSVDVTKTIARILIAAFLLSFLLAGGPAFAQPKTPQQFFSDLKNANTQVKAAVTGQPAPDTAAPLTCDFKMLTRLTPENVVPTLKTCLSDANSTLVADTQRALDSAKSFAGPSGGATGDGDGINCLTPAVSLFQAGVQIPAVPAVIAADGTVTTPAVPAKDPGPILIWQKYREFTLSGALTSCQAWFNGPVQATIAASAGAGGAIIATAAGAAALVPK